MQRASQSKETILIRTPEDADDSYSSTPATSHKRLALNLDLGFVIVTALYGSMLVQAISQAGIHSPLQRTPHLKH